MGKPHYTEVTSADTHKLACPVAGCPEMFETYDAYHEHHHNEHIDD